MKLYLLDTDADHTSTLSIPTPGLQYFQTEFIGKRRGSSWIPPEVALEPFKHGRTDACSWMMQAPVISARAAACLAPFLKDTCELLELKTQPESDYVAVNVLHRQRLWAGWHGGLSDYTCLIKSFHDKCPISRLVGRGGSPIVTEEFVQTVIENKLTGFTFWTHRVSKLSAIFAGAISTVRPDALFRPRGPFVHRPLIDLPKTKDFQRYWDFVESEGLLRREDWL